MQSTLLSNTIGFFGGRHYHYRGSTPSTLGFNLALNSSDTRAIDDIRMRVGDRQTANFRVGTRYPITTSTYISLPLVRRGPQQRQHQWHECLQPAEQSYENPIPQIQFEDLGITLKATPTVQKSGYITLHVDLKIEALAGGVYRQHPYPRDRQFVSDITVTDGETALLASSLSKSESAAVSGLPGLGELPGFQTATADTTKEVDTSEMVLLITPHVVHHRYNMIAGPMIVVDLPREPD